MWYWYHKQLFCICFRAVFWPRTFGIPDLSAFLQVDLTFVLILLLGIVQPNNSALWKKGCL